MSLMPFALRPATIAEPIKPEPPVTIIIISPKFTLKGYEKEGFLSKQKNWPALRPALI
jgi:hypothetical protein